jgi:hypothetical protein
MFGGFALDVALWGTGSNELALAGEGVTALAEGVFIEYGRLANGFGHASPFVNASIEYAAEVTRSSTV